MQSLTIRFCKITDLPAIQFLQPEGWDGITYYFNFYCHHFFCHPIVAEQNSRIVGVANGIVNGETAWLSHIIVTPEFRKKGIGHKLTEYMINYLRQQGCKTQILIATELGEPVYQKLGFQVVGYYVYFRGHQLTDICETSHIRLFKRRYIPSILQIDKHVTGENRIYMLESFLRNSWVYLSDSQDVLGYFLPDFGEGQIIAINEQVGICLLQLKHSQKICKTALPAENKSGIEFLTANGFEQYTKAPRMILGPPINWKPENIYSRAGGFYGRSIRLNSRS